MEAAALRWSRIYGAEVGDSNKSALEVAIEALVRRVPIVIFSKTTCPCVFALPSFSLLSSLPCLNSPPSSCQSVQHSSCYFSHL